MIKYRNCHHLKNQFRFVKVFKEKTPTKETMAAIEINNTITK
jgi:hypothetical protein